MGNELATRPADVVPAYSMGDMQVMARAVAASGLGGIRNEGAALTLLLLSQAEGLHPIQALRQFHIIEGRPTLRADAMQARFEGSGGRIKWLKRDDTECRAIFYKDADDEHGLEVAFTLEDARRAGLSNKDNWKKYPRPMMHARVISEGVRAVRPDVVVGFYTPEEVADFDPPQPKRVQSSVVPAVEQVPLNELEKQPTNEQLDPEFYKVGREAAIARGFPAEIFDLFVEAKLEGKPLTELHERHRRGILGKLRRVVDASKPVDDKNSNYDGELFQLQAIAAAELRKGPTGADRVMNRVNFELEKKKTTLQLAGKSVREEILKHINSGDWDAYLVAGDDTVEGTVVNDEPLDNTVAFNLFSDLGRAQQITDDAIDAAWDRWTATIGIGNTDPVPADKHGELLKAVEAKTFDWSGGAAGTTSAAA